METPSDCSDIPSTWNDITEEDVPGLLQAAARIGGRLEDQLDPEHLFPQGHEAVRRSSRSMSTAHPIDVDDFEDAVAEGRVHDDANEGSSYDGTNSPRLFDALRECLFHDARDALELESIEVPPSQAIDPAQMSKSEIVDAMKGIAVRNCRFWASGGLDYLQYARMQTYADVDLYRLLYSQGESFGTLRLQPTRKSGMFCKDRLLVHLPGNRRLEVSGKPSYRLAVIGRRNANIDLVIDHGAGSSFRWDSHKWSAINAVILDSYAACQGPVANSVGLAAAPPGDIILDVRESSCKAFLNDVLRRVRTLNWMDQSSQVYLYVHSCGHGDAEPLTDSSVMDDLILNGTSLIDGIVDIGIEFQIRSSEPVVLLFKRSFLLFACRNAKYLHPKLLLENVADATVHYAASSAVTKEKVYTTDVYSWRFRGIVPFAGSMPLARWATARPTFLQHLPFAVRSRIEKSDERQCKDWVIVQEAAARLSSISCPARYEMTVSASSFRTMADEVLEFCASVLESHDIDFAPVFLVLTSAKYAEYMAGVLSVPLVLSEQAARLANSVLSAVAQYVTDGETSKFASASDIISTQLSEIAVLHDIVRFCLTGNIYYVSHGTQFSQYIQYLGRDIYAGLPCIKTMHRNRGHLESLIVYASRGLQVRDDLFRRCSLFLPVTVMFENRVHDITIEQAACVFWLMVQLEVEEQTTCATSEWHYIAQRAEGDHEMYNVEDYIEGLLGRYSPSAQGVHQTSFHRMFARLYANARNMTWQDLVRSFIGVLRRHRDFKKLPLVPQFGASGPEMTGWVALSTLTPHPLRSQVQDGYDSDKEKRYCSEAKSLEYSVITTVMYDFICFLMQSGTNLKVGPQYQIEVAMAVTYVLRLQTGITTRPRRYEKGHTNFMTLALKHVKKEVLINSGIFSQTTMMKDRSEPWRIRSFAYWKQRTLSTRTAAQLADESLMRLPSLHSPPEEWRPFRQRVLSLLSQKPEES